MLKSGVCSLYPSQVTSRGEDGAVLFPVVPNVADLTASAIVVEPSQGWLVPFHLFSLGREGGQSPTLCWVMAQACLNSIPQQSQITVWGARRGCAFLLTVLTTAAATAVSNFVVPRGSS